MTTDILAVLDRLDALMSNDLAAAYTAPQGYARAAAHSYAAAQMEKAIAAVVQLLPEPDAREWLAMRRSALSPRELAVIGR